MLIRFRIATENTNAVTVNVNGLGVKALVLPDASAIGTGMLKVGNVLEAVYDGTRFRLLDWPANGISSIVQNVGRTVFVDDVAGTRTWTVPEGVWKISVELWGAAAGTYASYGNNLSSGGSGGGGYSKKAIAVTPGQVCSYTVGAGGAYGVSGVAPGNGGTKSFDAVFSATGSTKNPLATVANPTFGGIGGDGLGGDVNIQGQGGSSLLISALGSAGGGSFGFFPSQGPNSGAGSSGLGPGAGGTGAGTQNNTSIYIGSAGRNGRVQITY